MLTNRFRECLATLLVASLAATAAPAFAAPAPAVLHGTVLAAATPMAGVVVVVKDVDGARLAAATTGDDGSFTVSAVPAGVRTIGLETSQGAFDVATPITLAPGETKGVHLAVRQETEEEKEKKKGGAYASGGNTAAMIVTIVGFAVMGGLAVDSMGDDDPTTLPASPSNPD